MVYRDTIRQQDLNKAADVAMNDEEIIRRVVNGDKDLYSLIVRKYNQRLYRIGLSIINNDSAIEDIMQSTYIKAYENLDKFKFEAAFSTWITRILINESLLFLKKQEQVTNMTNHNSHDELCGFRRFSVCQKLSSTGLYLIISITFPTILSHLGL